MSEFSLSISNRFSVLQTHAEWQHYTARVWVELVKVPLSYWQFLVRLLLVICLCFCVAHLFWLLFPTPTIPFASVNISVASNQAAMNASSINSSGINIVQLKSLHLFGKTNAAKKEVVPLVQIPSSETQLNLILTGVVTSNYEKMERAIIGADNKQYIYAVGAALPVGDGVILVKVMRDRVIINNNGKYEALFLYQNDGKTKAVATHDSPAMSREESQRMLEWEADHAEPEVVASVKHPTVSLPDQAITALGRSMSNAVTMNTFNEGGKMVGFKLSPGRDTDKFKALGLQTGDVVIAVNGWPMSDSAQILEMYNNLGSSATLQVKRGTNVMTVDVGLQ